MSLVYVIAGEASGDVLGGRLISSLRARRPDLSFAGIGGAAMAEQGVGSLFPMRELALMGLLEVLPNILHLRRRLNQTVADITMRHPALVVTIDSPGFTLRVLKKIQPLGIKRVHYVAPQVWAWREGRVKHFPGLWDRLLCLLPFEPDFFTRHNLPARFVGHPVLESGANAGNAARFRSQNGLAAETKILTIMPGSRRAEVFRLLPILGETLRLIAARVPGVVPVVPAAGPVAERVAKATSHWSPRPIIVTEATEKHDAFAASMAALTKSGTSTLELALAGVPMIVTYRVNPITAAIAQRLVKVQYASILNLLARRAVLPEFLQKDCASVQLAEALVPLLTNPMAAQAQRDAVRPYLDMLRLPTGENPSDAAADAVLELLDQP
ncbi:MAG: lipid-A-disaccharide synthase [Acetobacteraceae bacterium]|nr:lipid-A-disaccharide synthase [Acetobacteraceae bacterium]